MKQFFHISLICLIFFSFAKDTFKASQLKYSRVRSAYSEKEDSVKKLCASKSLNYENIQVFLRIFKKEKEMELWGRSGSTGKYTLLKTFKVCNISGDPGPKRKMGDGQMPEGFYHIDRFNPQSSYLLSLGISYPNASDRILGSRDNLGGDIFIHGSCVTIGCVPVSDSFIQEIYILAVEAKDNGQQKIPVHLFPCRMTTENVAVLKESYKGNETLLKFWENIKTGYDLFEKNKIPPTVSIHSTGNYLLN